MNKEEIKFADDFTTCKSASIKSINTCYHPNCNLASINSHILQKNGILSSIAENKHLWHMEVNQFKSPILSFKRTGINNAYSFNCFCSDHDSALFKKIEGSEINFDDYESSLLFTLRTIYNEIWRKEVNLKVYDCLLNKNPDKKTDLFLEFIEQERLGLRDLKETESNLWDNLNNLKKDYVFKHRKISRIELCLSAFFNYQTTEELMNYKILNQRDMEKVSPIFINLFPYKDNSILLMGYNKCDENIVKGYFNTYFKENEKRVQRKLTNLMLFQCETWVVSEKLFEEKIKNVQQIFNNTFDYSTTNGNERRIFDINIFQKDFYQKLQLWNKTYFSTNLNRGIIPS